MDRVNTGSGSDLVSDQHAIFPKIHDSNGWTRSLPLPVLTDPSAIPTFEATPFGKANHQIAFSSIFTSMILPLRVIIPESDLEI